MNRDKAHLVMTKGSIHQNTWQYKVYMTFKIYKMYREIQNPQRKKNDNVKERNRSNWRF